MSLDLKTPVGLLSYPGSPLLYPAASALLKLGYQNLHAISDGREINQKFVEIILQRTNGKAVFHSTEDFKNLALQFHFVSNHNSDECHSLLKDLKIQILGSCGTPRKLKETIFNFPKFGTINCHPGRLPLYRGSSTVEWALLNGDEVASTSHFMVADYDAGPIISIEPLTTRGLDYYEIRTAMITHQAKHLAHSIDQVLRAGKSPKDYPQQSEGRLWEVFPESRLSELLNRKF